MIQVSLGLKGGGRLVIEGSVLSGGEGRIINYRHPMEAGFSLAGKEH